MTVWKSSSSESNEGKGKARVKGLVEYKGGNRAKKGKDRGGRKGRKRKQTQNGESVVVRLGIHRIKITKREGKDNVP